MDHDRFRTWQLSSPPEYVSLNSMRWLRRVRADERAGRSRIHRTVISKNRRDLANATPYTMPLTEVVVVMSVSPWRETFREMEMTGEMSSLCGGRCANSALLWTRWQQQVSVLSDDRRPIAWYVGIWAL